MNFAEYLTPGVVAGIGAAVYALAAKLVNRHLRLIEELEKTVSALPAALAGFSAELAASRKAREDDARTIAALQATIDDRRLSDLGDETRRLADAFRTGQHPAVDVERPEPPLDESRPRRIPEEAREAAQPPGRRPQSHPARR